MAIDPADFRAALGRFASGITVVTTRDDEGRDFGMTVSAFSSLSLEPPLILVCIDTGASVAPMLERCETFAVNVLAEGQEAISRQFAEREVDRFDGVTLRRGLHGLALLEDALANLQCQVVTRHPAGDHTVLVGEVQATESREGRPLLYYRGGYHRLDG